jgi:peroxiredoxin
LDLGVGAAVVGSGGLGTPIVRAMKLGIPALVDKPGDVYRSFGLDRALGLLQKSATFLLDEQGVVRDARASFNPQQSFDLDAVLRVLEMTRR